MSGGRIDPDRAFSALRIAVLTVSDSRDASTDSSGDLLTERIVAAGHELSARTLLKHDKTALLRQAQAWIADPSIEVIICNGGTGLSERDIAPEVWRSLFDREFEGFTVLWHLISYESVGVSTIQSRACAGIAGNTVVYALPGSTGACRDGWDRLISLQLDSRHRPCSAVELIPRFQRR
jgi:molybdenum cofactor biosynthesis protein B